MLADLHTHSRASDGALPPDEVLALAAAAGVELLSITDHDTIAAYRDKKLQGNSRLTLIPGIEFSSVWNNTGIHVVGLNIAPDDPILLAGVESQLRSRSKRAEMIAARLEKLGFYGALKGAREFAGEAPLGRPHFAAWLVESGHISDEKTAFKKHLGQGKSCDIRTEWPAMKAVIEWIVAAGGVAVLAHPAKYKFTNRKLEELVSAFAADGGRGIEVVCGKQPERTTQQLARLAARHRLLASCGSDFHRPGQHWAEPGNFPALPAGCKPVWEHW